MSSEPTPLEITVSSSVGGKVQIIKFEYSEDYHFSQSEKWSIPEDWSDEQVAEFRSGKQEALDADLQKLAQARVDELIEQKYGANNE
jgi:hypothetical protein